MSYTRVATNDADDHDESLFSPSSAHAQIPTSPPPSFRSRTSSPVLRHDPLRSDADSVLHDTFDSPSDDEDNSDNEDEGRRLVRSDTVPVANGNGIANGNGNADSRISPPVLVRSQIPVTFSGRTVGGGNHDGVFANLSAKPTRGEDLDEKPPVRVSSLTKTAMIGQH
jgi:hypothetical protein